jgi:stage III sporulation protein AA
VVGLQTTEVREWKRLEQQLLPVLAPRVRELVRNVLPTVCERLQEIRLRQHRPLQLNMGHGEAFITQHGELTQDTAHAYILQPDDLASCLQLLTQSSLYAMEEELRKGFITLPGGHRVGLSGRVVLNESGNVLTMRDITHLNIRIAREIKGISNGLEHVLVDTARRTLCNTLIIAPPQCGKTTLLRDLSRRISDGVFHPSLPGMKVALVDERSELAATFQGTPQHDVGIRTDVLDACPKAVGMTMMIRSMSPDVLMTDEIGHEEDSQAILEAIHAGVKVVATAHGFGPDDVQRRPSMHRLFQHHVFDRYVVLSRRTGTATVEFVYDKQGRTLSFLRRERRG